MIENEQEESVMILQDSEDKADKLVDKHEQKKLL
jgi:hypothetical protein